MFEQTARLTTLATLLQEKKLQQQSKASKSASPAPAKRGLNMLARKAKKSESKKQRNVVWRESMWLPQQNPSNHLAPKRGPLSEQ
jgi:hypothetical protein